MQRLAGRREDVYLARADSYARCDLGVAERRLRLEPRAHCTQSVVFVKPRKPEHRDCGVAEGPLERAAVPLDGLADELEVTGPERTVRLRVESSGELVRVDEVADEHSHGPPVRGAVGTHLVRRPE